MTPLILRLDSTGQAIGWMTWQETVMLYAKNMVSWTLGKNTFRIHGGINRITCERSYIDIASIIATYGVVNTNKFEAVPPLTNRELFRRDQHTCMYCLITLPDHKLTRDHIKPIAQLGTNIWTNVVAACVKCNQKKGCRTPEQAKMKLHAIPYTPNYAEWLVLRNRRILSDQMEFLKAQFNKNRRQ